MEYRKVLFRLGDEDGYHPKTKEEENEEQDQATMRPGKFHMWVPCIKHNPRTDKDEPGWAALIEDESGYMYEIDFTYLRFVNE